MSGLLTSQAFDFIWLNLRRRQLKGRWYPLTPGSDGSELSGCHFIDSFLEPAFDHSSSLPSKLQCAIVLFVHYTLSMVDN